MYEWLDINADFNQPLYISNIVEIFERHLGVVHANIRLEPEFIGTNGEILSADQARNNADNIHYNSYWDNPSYSKYTYTEETRTNNSDGTYSIETEEKNPIADTINRKLMEFVNILYIIYFVFEAGFDHDYCF